MKSLIRTHFQVPFNSNTQISQTPTPTPQPPVSPQDNTFSHSPQHLELPPVRWTFWPAPNLFRKLRPGVSVVGSKHGNPMQIGPVIDGAPSRHEPELASFRLFSRASTRTSRESRSRAKAAIRHFC